MALLFDITISNAWIALCAWSIAYTAWLVIYRLCFHPIARFPGSPWAKITFWYEFYYEWIKPGKYHERIYEMHQQYGKKPTISLQINNLTILRFPGPIIRVSPDEIHISDPLFYHELFVPFNVRRTNAYSRYAQGTGFEGRRKHQRTGIKFQFLTFNSCVSQISLLSFILMRVIN